MTVGVCTKEASWSTKVKHLQEVFANNAPDEFVTDIAVHDACYSQIVEELGEFDRDIVTALIRGDNSAEKEVRDWCIDMIFYILQYANRVGVIDKLNKDFNIIYMNNLTKSTDKDTAEMSKLHYDEQGIPVTVVKNKFDDYVVKRMSDNKVMKPIGYASVKLG